MTTGNIDRRAAIKCLALTGATAAAATGSARMAGALNQKGPELSITVLLDEPIGTIRPAIYSQFAEHIGGVIYDGIWVGPDSKIANIDGIRRTLVEHVRQLGPVVVRWPGG
jgi:alpha-L-arabinofuranosidase